MSSSARLEGHEKQQLGTKEMRLVADLRMMHTKVEELFSMIESMREIYPESEIIKSADYNLLARDIFNVDQIYGWFMKIKEERDAGTFIAR